MRYRDTTHLRARESFSSWKQAMQGPSICSKPVQAEAVNVLCRILYTTLNTPDSNRST